MDESKTPVQTELEETGRFITFSDGAGRKLTYPIHDFLLEFQINLGIDTVVQYVGYTKNPNARPLNGVHGGLSEVLYNVSNEENDIFFFFNLFKVMAVSENKEFNINFSVANSMTDEVKVDREGFILEKCFICYFDSENQTRNKQKERREIENDLLRFSKKHHIDSVAIHFEVNDGSEYYRFSSSNVDPKHQHVFTAKLVNSKLLIQNGAELFEQYVKPWV